MLLKSGIVFANELVTIKLIEPRPVAGRAIVNLSYASFVIVPTLLDDTILKNNDADDPV